MVVDASTRRAVLALLIMAVSACAPEAGPVPSIGEGDVRIELGLAGVVEPGRWNLLRLEVRNRGADFRGRLEVCGVLEDPFDEDPTTYGMDLEVPGGPGAPREVAFPVRPEGWKEVAVTFRGDGWARTLRAPVPQLPSGRFHVLVIAEKVPDLLPLQQHLEEQLAEGATDEVPALKPQFSVLAPWGCSTHAHAYEPFQVVMVFDAALAVAPAGSSEALAEWVRAGGTLVGFLDPGAAGRLPAAALELLAIEREAGGAGLRPASRARVLGAGSGLVALSEPGGGSVTTYTFNPLATGGAFPSRADFPQLHQILDSAFARAASFEGDFHAGLRELERAAGLRLAEMSGFEVPGRPAVVAWLLLYAALGFFIPRAIFRRLGKPEWTFAVMVIAAAAAIAGIYGLGVLSSLSEAEVEEITVVRLDPSGRSGRATSFLGVISPRFARVELDAPGALVQPMRVERVEPFGSAEPVRIPPSAIEVERGGAMRHESLLLYPNAMRHLRYDYPVTLEEGLTVERVASSQGDRMRVVNCRGEGLRLLLVKDGQCGEWKILAAGCETMVPEGRESLRLSPVARRGNSQELFLTRQSREPPEEAVAGDALHAVAFPRQRLFADFRARVQLGAGPTTGGPRPWGSRQPDFLVAVSRAPLFPPIAEVPVRKAVTLFVADLPPEGRE